MSDRRYKLINQGLPGNANFKTSDVADGDIIMWDSTEQKWVNVPASSLGTLIDHGDLLGLADDDHTQYHNDARGDARYLQLIGGTISGGLTVIGTLAADGTITGNGGAVNIATTGSDIVLQDLSETTTNLLWYDQSISLLYAATPDVPLALRGNLRFTNTGDGEIQSNDGTPWMECDNDGFGVLLDANVNGYSALTRVMRGLWLTGNGMNTTSKYTAAVKFGSTDNAFTTENPKFLAAIAGEAAQSYGADTSGGMNLSFFTTPLTPGATSVPQLAAQLRHDKFLRLYGTAILNGVNETVLSWIDQGAVTLTHDNVNELQTLQHDGDYKTSGSQTKDHSGTWREVGWNVMPIVERDSNLTLNENHVGKLLHRDATGNMTFTLPSGTSGAVPPVGAVTNLTNENGTGTVTIAAVGTLRWFAGTGTPATGNRTLAEGGIATVFHYSDTEWWIWGNGIA